MTPTEYFAFQTPQDLWAWLEIHHGTARELWVRMYKKASGTPSINWEDCVIAGLAWGWIDGQRQALDDVSFVQRLIGEGRMQPAGLVHVEAAKADGRWDAAYAGSSEMVIPADFLTALEGDAEARAFYGTLNRANLFSIYHRLHTAKRPETRAKRMMDILAKLGRKETF